MSQHDDDLFIEGAKRIKQLIQDKNIKPMDIVNALEVSRGTVSKWLQGSSTPSAQSLMELAKFLGVTERWILESKDVQPPKLLEEDSVNLKKASVEQLMNELKARYAELNLKAEIKISVEPMKGGFVVNDESKSPFL